MKIINAFQTADGTLFQSEEMAEKHEIVLNKEVEIDAYLLSHLNQYPARTQRTIARNSVVGWELWKLKNADKTKR